MPRPDRLARPRPDDYETYEDVTGEQLEWGFATPWVFRALSSPRTNEPILDAPRAPVGLDDCTPCAYWASLLTLLLYSFGWARPDRGLRWWFDAGKPTDDPRLQLISQVWDADGQLDWFAAWLWTSNPALVAERLYMLNQLTGYRDDGEPVAVDEAWIEAVRGDADAFGRGTPFGSRGSDPLHLSRHSNGPLREPHGITFLRSPTTEGRAVLLLDSMVGWYRALAEHGQSLPELHGRSWQVDVVARPVGVLGTYRRSRTTGLWFAGKHSLHARGT